MKVIMAMDFAFILLRFRRNSPGLRVRETALKDGDFPLPPSQYLKFFPTPAKASFHQGYERSYYYYLHKLYII